MKEFLKDISFEEGFDLLSTKTTEHRKLSGVLNYDGLAKGNKRHWVMSQWWNPQDWDFINAKFTNDNGVFKYVNGTRKVIVESSKNTITLELDSHSEYMHLFNRTRKDNENWSHVLLEQNLEEPIHLNRAKKIICSLDYVVNFDEDRLNGQPNVCSQATWYFTFTDPKNGDSDYESNKDTNPNDFFWFGLPLYDTRFKHLDGYKHVDTGFVGATNKLIYNIPSSTYINGDIKIGQKYHVEIDILPYVLEAIKYGKKGGALKNSSIEDLILNYMNIGWEIPGSYKASITFSNLSIKSNEN